MQLDAMVSISMCVFVVLNLLLVFGFGFMNLHVFFLISKMDTIFFSRRFGNVFLDLQCSLSVSGTVSHQRFVGLEISTHAEMPDDPIQR